MRSPHNAQSREQEQEELLKTYQTPHAADDKPVGNPGRNRADADESRERRSRIRRSPSFDDVFFFLRCFCCGPCVVFPTNLSIFQNEMMRGAMTSVGLRSAASLAVSASSKRGNTRSILFCPRDNEGAMMFASSKKMSSSSSSLRTKNASGFPRRHHHHHHHHHEGGSHGRVILRIIKRPPPFPLPLFLPLFVIIIVGEFERP